MTKFAIAFVAAAATLAALPAAAETTGTINVTGNVQSRCSVIQPGGSTEASTFSGTIALGRLDAADGTLKSALAGSTSATPAQGLTVSTRIVCNSANPTVGIAATKLNTGGATDPGTGYSNNVDYTAQVKVKTASGSTQTVSYSTGVGGAATTAKLGQRIAGGATDNFEVSAYGLAASNGATSLLAAGDYASVITVSIDPTI